VLFEVAFYIAPRRVHRNDFRNLGGPAVALAVDERVAYFERKRSELLLAEGVNLGLVALARVFIGIGEHEILTRHPELGSGAVDVVDIPRDRPEIDFAERIAAQHGGIKVTQSELVSQLGVGMSQMPPIY